MAPPNMRPVTKAELQRAYVRRYTAGGVSEARTIAREFGYLPQDPEALPAPALPANPIVLPPVGLPFNPTASMPAPLAPLPPPTTIQTSIGPFGNPNPFNLPPSPDRVDGPNVSPPPPGPTDVLPPPVTSPGPMTVPIGPSAPTFSALAPPPLAAPLGSAAVTTSVPLVAPPLGGPVAFATSPTPAEALARAQAYLVYAQSSIQNLPQVPVAAAAMAAAIQAQNQNLARMPASAPIAPLTPNYRPTAMAPPPPTVGPATRAPNGAAPPPAPMPQVWNAGPQVDIHGNAPPPAPMPQASFPAAPPAAPAAGPPPSIFTPITAGSMRPVFYRTAGSVGWFRAGADPSSAPPFSPLSPAPPNGLPDPSSLLPPGLLSSLSLPPSLGPVSAFALDAARGQKVLDAFAHGQGGRNETLSPDDFRQGLMAALFQAEAMAVQVGLAPSLPTTLGQFPRLTTGEMASFIVGSATDNAKISPLPEAKLYLAIHAAVNDALNRSHATSDPNAAITMGTGNIVPAALPALAIVAIVVLVAALVAGAYVAAVKVQVDGEPLARVKALTELAKQRAAGVPIPANAEELVTRPSGGTNVNLGGMGTALVVGGLAVGAFLFLRK